MAIDIRLVTLYKLHIPKTKSFLELANLKADVKEHCCYFTTGHYDLIDIAPVKAPEGGGEHVLSAAHKQMGNLVNKHIAQDAFSKQKLLVFTNKGDNGISEKDINDFWQSDEEHHSKMFFVSMLHMNDKFDLDKILRYLKTCFGKIQHLYYFSFDYSDIIIFCRANTVKDFVEAINKLNYDSKNKYFRDSFSLYGMCRTHLIKRFKEIKKGKNNPENTSDTFFMKLNLGVRNRNLLDQFLMDVRKIDKKSKTITQIGRHDYALINENATIDWLIELEYLVDRYTTVDENRKEDTVFCTFEAFIGYDDKSEYKDSPSNPPETISTQMLKNKCKALKKNLDVRFENAGNYYTPIFEVENSIESIIKNGFAEDFVLCMYESFYSFVDYVNEKVRQMKKPENGKTFLLNNDFSSLFNDYFKGLISLANSGMHADRSFIQATAFNAILFDVPPKLMSLYTALVYKMAYVLRDIDRYNYTFLFTPDFSESIRVSMVSYEPKTPENRLLLVSINETFFYRPGEVISTMAHETAHFAGDVKRSRKERAEHFVKCVVFYALNRSLPDIAHIEVDASYYEAVSEISKDVCDKMRLDEKSYVVDFNSIAYATLLLMTSSAESVKAVKRFLSKNSDKMETVMPVSNKADYLYSVVSANLENCSNMFIDENSRASKVIAYIKSVFKEAYADMQMVIMLGLGYEEYMDKLFKYEHVTAEVLNKDVHLHRISAVAWIMLTSGIWSMEDIRRYDTDINTPILAVLDDLRIFCSGRNYSEKNVEAYNKFCSQLGTNGSGAEVTCLYRIGDYEIPKNSNNYYCMQVYIYLTKALEKTLEKYSESKISEIKQLRETHKQLYEFNDITTVYKVFNTRTKEYKEAMIERIAIENGKQ